MNNFELRMTIWKLINPGPQLSRIFNPLFSIRYQKAKDCFFVPHRNDASFKVSLTTYFKFVAYIPLFSTTI